MYKILLLTLIILSFVQCSTELESNKNKTPVMFVANLHRTMANNSNVLENILIPKKDLIKVLTQENKQKAYNYDSRFFSMATDKQAYDSYIKDIFQKYNNIKKKEFDWENIEIQKAAYETDSLKINLKGLLIIRDSQNRTDSIYFTGVKILDYWCLYKLN